MFSKIKTDRFTQNFSERIDRARKAIADADAVIFPCQCLWSDVILLITLQGLLTATELDSISFTTTLPAPITLHSCRRLRLPARQILRLLSIHCFLQRLDTRIPALCYVR